MSEEAHTAITRRHFGINWREPEHYDLVLSTERLSVDECVDEIENMMRMSRFQETPESIRIVENLALEWGVRAALKRDPAHLGREHRRRVRRRPGPPARDGRHAARRSTAPAEVAAARRGRDGCGERAEVRPVGRLAVAAPGSETVGRSAARREGAGSRGETGRRSTIESWRHEWW